MVSQEMIDRLKDFSLFKEFSDDNEKMNVIASIMEPRNYKKGDYIFKQGDQGKELFILRSGTVRVCKNTKLNEEYTIVDLQAEWNVFFGEIALMDNDERSASI
ncbi:MAG: cyclic nucleotide-binding domain-containing protein, partial [Proteobacteria bacterium]|nr:cyclic nucleotide-binding domain-containing protein [Pseudomonadota bacterium]